MQDSIFPAGHREHEHLSTRFDGQREAVAFGTKGFAPEYDVVFARAEGVERQAAENILGAFDGNFATLEVKEEIKVAVTGNFFLEYSCNGHDSGLYVTEADAYLFVHDGYGLWFPTSELHHIVRAWEVWGPPAELGVRRTQTWRDPRNRAWGFVVPARTLTALWVEAVSPSNPF